MKEDKTQDDLLRALATMPNEELAEVFGHASQVWGVWDFFLGIATSDLVEDDSGKTVGAKWQPNAVASPDTEVYPDGVQGPLDKEGSCRTCGTRLISCAERAICPICLSQNHFT